jgi:hypothetical protein
MKTKSVITKSIIILLYVLLAGCSKETILPPDKDAAASSIAEHNWNRRECQLTHIDHGNGSTEDFRYNTKGLADEWRIDLGDGSPVVFKMEYNHHQKLIKAKLYSGGVLYATIKFVYTNGRIVRDVWYDGESANVINEIKNTYNKRGQLIVRESSISGIRVVFKNNYQGNTLQSDLYFENNLYLSNGYTYNKFNRNPYLSVNGIPHAFPFYQLNFTPAWASSEKITMIEGATATVIKDEDPIATTMKTGTRSFLTSLNTFERVSGSNVNCSFKYQNCCGDDDYDNSNASTQLVPEEIMTNKNNLLKIESIIPNPVKEILRMKNRQLKN